MCYLLNNTLYPCDFSLFQKCPMLFYQAFEDYINVIESDCSNYFSKTRRGNFIQCINSDCKIDLQEFSNVPDHRNFRHYKNQFSFVLYKGAGPVTIIPSKDEQVLLNSTVLELFEKFSNLLEWRKHVDEKCDPIDYSMDIIHFCFRFILFLMNKPHVRMKHENVAYVTLSNSVSCLGFNAFNYT